MLGERRCKTEILAEILKGAIKGKRVDKIITEHNISWNQFLEYVRILTELELIRIERPAKYFVSEDGREYNVMYITTEKGLRFIESYKALKELLGEENHSDKCHRIATLTARRY